ncbi:ABC transporter permease subunit, partial [Christensenellaceae bacterium OttesenSCG-928-M15]|nr:ABC transporter permease subunit [Christensenellaceae bacterium OttesenSCG-928-M15]
GFALGIVRSFKIPVIDQILAVYAQISRGVPIMIILLFIYATIRMGSPYWTSITALVFVEGAYIMEIIKGGMQTVDKGQWEAARAMSLPLPVVLLRIIIPQVMLVSLPALIGQVVLLIKGTVVASTIGCMELTREVSFLLPIYANPLVLYGYVLIIFFILCRVITVIGTRLEKKVVYRIMGDIHGTK